VHPLYPAADTERSQHDFHCQRAKDESHYTDEDGRALPTNDPQNRIRKKQQKIGQEEHQFWGAQAASVLVSAASRKIFCSGGCVGRKL
jgi:hypothetical protein